MCAADSPRRSGPRQCPARLSMPTAACWRRASGSLWRRSPSPLHVHLVSPTRGGTTVIARTGVEHLRSGRDGCIDLLAHRGYIRRLGVGRPEGREDRKCAEDGASHDATLIPKSSGSISRSGGRGDGTRSARLLYVGPWVASIYHRHAQARNYERGGGLPRGIFSRVELPHPTDRDTVLITRRSARLRCRRVWRHTTLQHGVHDMPTPLWGQKQAGRQLSLWRTGGQVSIRHSQRDISCEMNSPWAMDRSA